MTRRLVLASASETRLRVLRQAGFDPEVVVSGVDETTAATSLSAIVRELAERKARAVADQHPDAVVLACDSLVDAGGRILGKPSSREEAMAWWRDLRGRCVTVWTGHAVVVDGHIRVRAASAEVRFGLVTEADIERYCGTDEPLGAAGAFRLDGRAAAFVESVTGDPGTVHGVSISTVHEMLDEMGVEVTDLWA